jgi:hypothetical protein
MSKLKLIGIVFLMVGMAGGGYAQEISVEVKSFMEDYFKAARSEDVLSHSKSGRDPTDWIQAVQVEDLRVGRVLEVYILLEIFPLKHIPIQSLLVGSFDQPAYCVFW